MSDLFTAVGKIMLFYSRDHRKRTKQKNNNREKGNYSLKNKNLFPPF